MPPKQKFSRQDIIEAAFNVVRKQGWKKFTARTIATELNSSTQPIYDNFLSMEHIEAEVVKKAMAYFYEFISREITGDKWLDQMVGYVLFAEREKYLFQAINDEKHTPLQMKFALQHWVELGENMSEDERFMDVPDEKKHQFRVARWMLAHGMAYIINSGWYDAKLSEDSLFTKEIGLHLIDFLKKADKGLYEEFKK